MMTCLLLPKTFSELDMIKRSYIFSIISDENSSFYLPLRNKVFILKNFSVILAESFLLILRIILELREI